MSKESKLKLIIFSAIAIVAIFLIVIVFQTVDIIKAKKQLLSQNQQIETLEKKLDYYEDKRPNSPYEEIN